MKLDNFLYLQLSYFLVIAQYITFDYGSYTEYIHTCHDSMSYSIPQYFSGQFANLPQIIVISNKYDTDVAPIQFNFDITNIQKTCIISLNNLEFTFTIQCFYSSTSNVYTYEISWVAIDDQRIEVINSFNQYLGGTQNKVYTFPHNNLNALYGFVSMTSFGFSGPMDFSLHIQSITYNQVQVEFAATNTNQLAIGFQVILGTKETFNISAIISTGYVSASPFYYSNQLNIPTGSIALIPYSALHYDNEHNQRHQKIVTKTSTSETFRIECCKIITILGGNSTIDNFNYQWILMNISNAKIIYPFQLLKMTFTKAYLQTIDVNPWKVFVSEFNQTFTSPTFQQITILLPVLTLTVQLTAQCDTVKLTGITGLMLQCFTCNPQYKAIAANCSSEVNTLNYQFILYQPDQINQQVQLSVLSSGFRLYQQAIKKEGYVNYTLLNVQIVNY